MEEMIIKNHKEIKMQRLHKMGLERKEKIAKMGKTKLKKKRKGLHRERISTLETSLTLI